MNDIIAAPTRPLFELDGSPIEKAKYITINQEDYPMESGWVEALQAVTTNIHTWSSTVEDGVGANETWVGTPSSTRNLMIDLESTNGTDRTYAFISPEPRGRYPEPVDIHRGYVVHDEVVYQSASPPLPDLSAPFDGVGVLMHAANSAPPPRNPPEPEVSDWLRSMQSRDRMRRGR